MSATDMFQSFFDEVLKPAITAAVTKAVKDTLEDMDDDKVTVSEAAEMLRLSEKSVYRYIEQGKLTSLQPGGKIILSRKEVKGLGEARQTSRVKPKPLSRPK